jgi:ribonuclease-3
VIHCITAIDLYRGDPAASEGELTRRRAAQVSSGALAQAARRLGLGDYLRVSPGVSKSGGRDLDSLLANSLEAVVGAIYMDGGMRAATRSFRRVAGSPAEGAVNYKGILQEMTQATAAGTPSYRLLDASGPDHARLFRVAVAVAGDVLGEGEGATLRAAEQAAARVAVEALNTTYGGPTTANPQYVDRRGPG